MFWPTGTLLISSEHRGIWWMTWSHWEERTRDPTRVCLQRKGSSTWMYLTGNQLRGCYTPFLNRETGSERSSNFSKVTQLASGSPQIYTLVCLTLTPKLNKLKIYIPVIWSQLIGKYPDAGKDWGQEGKGAAEDEVVGWITQAMDMNLSKLWEIVEDRETWWRAAVQGVSKSQTWLSDWTSETA